jgi:response regulator RpfG family c-di-GMP phosphodiesterase
MATFREIVPMVRHHHEHWDGSGYPDGLMGDRIPLTSRIIMFADTIDAMTSTRPYRRALTPADVRSEIFKFRGRQFDPKVADLLLSSPRWDELFLDTPFRVIRGSLGAHQAPLGVAAHEPAAKGGVALGK